MKKRVYITVPLFFIITAVVIVTYMFNRGPVISEVYGYEIVNTFPHDTEAFTQGLIYEDGILYESTGQVGFSSIRKVELETGKVLQIYNMPGKYFGEGIAIWEDKIVQLTWVSEKGFVYDKETFEPKGEFSYRTEGWGITHDDKHLIMSDGSPVLYFLNPETYKIESKIAVSYKGHMQGNLNELEYINGKVFANIWGSSDIVIIDPASGEIESVIDLDGLLDESMLEQPVDVLNGIAYDEKNERLFVTGKWWPYLFEIKLVPKKKD